MLENILSEINLSLKGIVKALEELGKIAKEPLEISTVDIAKEATNEIENSTQNAQAVQQQVTPAQQQVLTQTNAVTQASAQVNAQVSAQVPQVPMQQTIPTTQVAESFTQEQLAVAMSNAVAAGKMSVIQGILQSFGVQALTQINPTDYNKVATMLKEAGVQV